MAKKRRYNSVSQMVRGVSETKAFADEFDEAESRRRLVKQLFALRLAKGVTQKDVASILECSQSRVSKVENSEDCELRLGDLSGYAKALDLELRLVFTKKTKTIVDEVKYHALTIKTLLDRLANLAHSDETIAKRLAKFYGEAFFNFVRIVLDAAQQLPESVREEGPCIRIELQEVEPAEATGKAPAPDVLVPQ